VRVEVLNRGLLLLDLGLQSAHALAVARDVGVGKLAVKLLDAGLPLDNLVLDVADFAEFEAALLDRLCGLVRISLSRRG